MCSVQFGPLRSLTDRLIFPSCFVSVHSPKGSLPPLSPNGMTTTSTTQIITFLLKASFLSTPQLSLKMASASCFLCFLFTSLTFPKSLAFTSSTAIQTVQEILQIESLQHRFHPKTLWSHSLPRGENETLPVDLSADLLPSLPDIPVLLGSFGKPIRAKHIHLTSFLFLVLLPSSRRDASRTFKMAQSLVLSNGNKRRDRFLFIFTGSGDQTLSFFRSQTIIDLQHKVGFLPDQQTLLRTPIIFSKEGDMETHPLSPSSLPLAALLREMPLMGQNLRGRHLRITGCLLPTWMYQISADPLLYDGSNYRLFLFASLRFNYTFEIYAPPDQGYGALLPNGTWTGMAADLYYTERGFDIAILLGHVLGWFHFIDFATPLDFARLVFVTSPPSLVTADNAFLLPFQTEVWITIVLFEGIMSLILLIFLAWKRKKYIQDLEKGRRKKKRTEPLKFAEALFHSLWIPYAAALEQQNTKVPRNMRSLACIWMIATIITGTGYRANLASYLSIPSVSEVPSTFDQLAASDYSVDLNNLGVAEQQFFDFSDNPTVKTLRKRMGFNPDPVECPKLAFLKERMACIAWTPLVSAFASLSLSINTRMNFLQHSSEPVLPVSMSIGFGKDSVIVDSFIPITGSIYESGLYDKWTEDGYDFFKATGKKALEKGEKTTELYQKLKEFEYQSMNMNNIKPFSMGNLKLPFYFLGLAAALAGISFNWENCTRIRPAKITKLPTKMDKVKTQAQKIYVKSQLGNLEIQIKEVETVV